MDYKKQLQKLKAARKIRAEARKAAQAYILANPEHAAIEKQFEEKRAIKAQETKKRAASLIMMTKLLSDENVKNYFKTVVETEDPMVYHNMLKKDPDKLLALLAKHASPDHLQKIGYQAKTNRSFVAKRNPPANPGKKYEISVEDIEKQLTEMGGQLRLTEEEAEGFLGASTPRVTVTRELTQEQQDRLASMFSEFDTGSSSSSGSAVSKSEPGSESEPEPEPEPEDDIFGHLLSKKKSAETRRRSVNAPRRAPMQALSTRASDVVLEKRVQLDEFASRKHKVNYWAGTQYRAPAFKPVIGESKNALLIMMMRIPAWSLFVQAIEPYYRQTKEDKLKEELELGKLITELSKLRAAAARESGAGSSPQAPTATRTPVSGSGSGSAPVSSSAKALEAAKKTLQTRLAVLHNELDKINRLIDVNQEKHKKLTHALQRGRSTPVNRQAIKETQKVVELRGRGSSESHKRDYEIVIELDQVEGLLSELRTTKPLVEVEIFETEAILASPKGRRLKELSVVSRPQIAKMFEPSYDAQIAELIKTIKEAESRIKSIESSLFNVNMQKVDKLLTERNIQPHITLEFMASHPDRARNLAIYTLKNAQELKKNEEASDAFLSSLYSGRAKPNGVGSHAMLRHSGRRNPAIPLLIMKSLITYEAPSFNEKINDRYYVPARYRNWFKWNEGDTVLGFVNQEIFVGLKGLLQGTKDLEFDEIEKQALRSCDLTSESLTSTKIGLQHKDFGPQTEVLANIISAISAFQLYNVYGWNNVKYQFKQNRAVGISYYMILRSDLPALDYDLTKSAFSAYMSAHEEQKTSKTQKPVSPTLSGKEFLTLLRSPVLTDSVHIPLMILSDALMLITSGVTSDENLNRIAKLYSILLYTGESNYGIAIHMYELLSAPAIVSRMTKPIGLNNRGHYR